MSDNPFGITGGTTTSSKDPTGWPATSQAKFDTTGMNIPGMTGVQTGAAILQALNSIALNKNADKSAWGPIRSILQHMQSYSTKDKTTVWNTKDENTLKRFLGSLNATNTTINKASPLSLAAFVAQEKAAFGITGTNLNSTQALTTQIYSVPNQADLVASAVKNFPTILGRTPTAQESADFAQKYQKLVESYDSAKASAKDGLAFAAPSNPIQFEQNGQSASALPASPSGLVDPLQAPPTPDVAAQNYAAKADPTAASAQAAADGLNQFMSMLKGQ